MASPGAWIMHPLESMPPILTEEDITTVSQNKIIEFYQGVKMLVLIRANSFPDELIDAVRSHPAIEFDQILYEALTAGVFMDVGWVDDWLHAVTELSARMRGFPRALKRRIHVLEAAARAPGAGVNQDRDQNMEDSAPVFRFLDLPIEVRQRVYRLFLLKQSIVVCDWAAGISPKGVRRRTDYDVRVGRDDRRTTYQVRALGRGQGIDLAIMSLNKQTYKEASQVFYEENSFKFLG
jgi:hypothetical protein